MAKDASWFEALISNSGVAAAATPTSTSVGFWGPPTAPINWCEVDYEVTPWIAEFWNSISNIIFVLVGLWTLSETKRLRLPWKFSALSYAIIFTGLASFAFHATLWLMMQRADEIFENWILIILARTATTTASSASSALLVAHLLIAAFGIVFVTAFLFCELHLISMALFNVARFASISSSLLPVTKGENALTKQQQQQLKQFRFRIFLATLYSLSGFGCWLVDRLACVAVSTLLPFNPQLHAVWHVLAALSLLEAFLVGAFAHLSLSSTRRGTLHLGSGFFARIDHKRDQ